MGGQITGSSTADTALLMAAAVGATALTMGAAAPQAGPPPGYMEVPGAPGSYVSIADFGSASA